MFDYQRYPEVIFISIHWCSLIFIDIHWCSLIFIILPLIFNEYSTITPIFKWIILTQWACCWKSTRERPFFSSDPDLPGEEFRKPHAGRCLLPRAGGTSGHRTKKSMVEKNPCFLWFYIYLDDIDDTHTDVCIALADYSSMVWWFIVFHITFLRNVCHANPKSASRMRPVSPGDPDGEQKWAHDPCNNKPIKKTWW